MGVVSLINVKRELQTQNKGGGVGYGGRRGWGGGMNPASICDGANVLFHLFMTHITSSPITFHVSFLRGLFHVRKFSF